MANELGYLDKWIAEHESEVPLFKEAYLGGVMSSSEIGEMFNFPIYAGTNGSSSCPIVSHIAKKLELPLKVPGTTRHNRSRKAKETANEKVERLRKELADAQKEQMIQLNSDEAKIRKFVESMGGIAKFQFKLRMIKF